MQAGPPQLVELLTLETVNGFWHHGWRGQRHRENAWWEQRSQSPHIDSYTNSLTTKSEPTTTRQFPELKLELSLWIEDCVVITRETGFTGVHLHAGVKRCVTLPLSTQTADGSPDRWHGTRWRLTPSNTGLETAAGQLWWGFPRAWDWLLLTSRHIFSSSSLVQTPAGSAAPDTWEHKVASWVYFNHLAAKISH